jgi:hypothetical protein
MIKQLAGITCCLLTLSLLCTNVMGAPTQDPTRPQTATEAGGQTPDAIQAELKLSYILRSQFRKLAIINGKPAKEGEQLFGYTVKKIKPYEVVLQRRDQTLTVPLVAQKGIKVSSREKMSVVNKGKSNQ